jgi:hypothetical protein
MSLGSYGEIWIEHSGRLPVYLRHTARLEVTRLVRRGDPITDATVAAHLADMRVRKTRRGTTHSPGSHEQRLNRLRAGLEIVHPGEYGPTITTEMHAIAPTGGKKTHRTPTPKRRGLPLQEWPPAKQEAWEAATRPAPSSYRLGGALAHLPLEQRNRIRSALGIFYAFLRRRGEMCLTPDAFLAFIREEQGRVREKRGPLAPGYIAGLVWAIYTGERAFLAEAAQTAARPNDEFADDFDTGPSAGGGEFEDDVIEPSVSPSALFEFEDDQAPDSYVPANEPLSWMRDQVVGLRRKAKPVRDKAPFRVELVEVVRYGLDLMDEADRMPFGEDAAIKHQLGFFVAILALRCVRLSTILSTDIPERGIVAPNRGWVRMPAEGSCWFYWPSAVVKGGVPIRTRVPELLRSRLARQVAYYRTALRGADANAALFVSRLSSRRWSKSAARYAFEEAMEEQFGKRAWPHLVRSFNAAFVCEEMPDKVLAGMLTDLLGHSNSQSDEPYKKLVRGEAAQELLERSAAAKATQKLEEERPPSSAR